MSSSSPYEEPSFQARFQETTRRQWSVASGGEDLLKNLTATVTRLNRDVDHLATSLFDIRMIVNQLEKEGLKEAAQPIRQELTEVQNKLAAISSQQHELHETSQTTQTQLKTLEDKVLAIEEKLADTTTHDSQKVHWSWGVQGEATEYLRKEICRIEAAQLKESTADNENSVDKLLTELEEFLSEYLKLNDTSIEESSLPTTPIHTKSSRDSGVIMSPSDTRGRNFSFSNPVNENSFGLQASSTPKPTITNAATTTSGCPATSDDNRLARSLLYFITSKKIKKDEKPVAS